jgi:hypothetical protein
MIRIVGRPERHRRGGVAGVGGAREKDARGNEITGLEELIPAVGQELHVPRIRGRC